MKRLEYRALIKDISERALLPEDTVKSFLYAFTDSVVEAMKREERIVIRHFGYFYAKRTTGRFPGVAARFKPAKEVKDILKEALKPVEKYNVEMNNEEVLLARVTGKCPVCKTDLDQKDPPHCPNCGTKPFEKKVGA